MVQNYGKIIYIKNIFENGWKEGAYPSSYPPGHKLVLDKNHQKSVAYISHLAPSILFFFTKRQIQKDGGHGLMPPSTYAPAFDHTFYTEADPESFGGGCNFELG